MSFKRKKNVEKKENNVLIDENKLDNNNKNDNNKISLEEMKRKRLKDLIVFIKKINDQINSTKEMISYYQQINNKLIKKMIFQFKNQIILKRIKV